MVTPLVRRRIIKVARETVTLDRLSGGRLILGLGLGGDAGRELSAFGETVDAKTRGDQLDEGCESLVRLWAGRRGPPRGVAEDRRCPDNTRAGAATTDTHLVRDEGHE